MKQRLTDNSEYKLRLENQFQAYNLIEQNFIIYIITYELECIFYKLNCKMRTCHSLLWTRFFSTMSWSFNLISASTCNQFIV